MQQDDSTLRNGKRFRETEVSRSPSPTSSHDDRQPSVTSHQPSSGVFQMYTHRPSPHSFSHDENSAEHSRIASPILAAADKSFLDISDDIDCAPTTQSKVPVQFASDSRAFSHSEPNSPTRDGRYVTHAPLAQLRARHSSVDSQDNHTPAAPYYFLSPDLQADQPAHTGHSSQSKWDFNSEEDDDPEVQFKSKHTRGSLSATIQRLQPKIAAIKRRLSIGASPSLPAQDTNPPPISEDPAVSQSDDEPESAEEEGSAPRSSPHSSPRSPHRRPQRSPPRYDPNPIHTDPAGAAAK